jgi:hypothetical protein
LLFKAARHLLADVLPPISGKPSDGVARNCIPAAFAAAEEAAQRLNTFRSCAWTKV